MGGLVEDITAFRDAANDIGGDPERSNVQIARHWFEASARHGMPVWIEGFRLFTAETTSTYPQNIAFKAAELTNPGLASRYQELMLRGHQDFRAIRAVIDTLTGGTLHPQAPEPTAQNVLAFLH